MAARRADERIARRVACPRCSAGVRQPCRTMTGTDRVVHAHHARAEAAGAWLAEIEAPRSGLPVLDGLARDLLR